MASKTLWKQMSGKLFTLIQILRGEGFQNIFLKHGLALNAQEAGLNSWDICSPIVPQYLCMGNAAPALGTPREHQAGLGVLLQAEPGAAGHSRVGHRRVGHSRVGHSPHLVCLTLCILLVMHKPNPQTPSEISNILHYAAFTAITAACTAQTPPELSNKIWNSAPLAWDAQIFCNSYRRSWLTAGAASWHS